MSDVEDTSVQWASWHSAAAGYAAGVDFVTWLGGEAAAPQHSVATFRDAVEFLPLLDTCSWALCAHCCRVFKAWSMLSP